MKKIFLPIALLFSLTVAAQENMHPSPAQTGTIALTNGVIHIGNGEVIENGMIVFSNGKIIDVRPSAPIMDIKVFDLKGKHVYPGVIASSTNLGLVEISAVGAQLITKS